ncbi:hypothetical protein C344_06988 [Cryptococcus neoformans AD1-7a]|nr:hypothetical protein C344_06988 [Cryptococcus neoformans var. grubii AD1-7a]OXG70509.1 hypothetical protein C350_07072 [Cryptococcus neoformans var. grubii MW-RSA36]
MIQKARHGGKEESIVPERAYLSNNELAPENNAR